MAKLNASANSISNTYDSTLPSPFDARQTVETFDDLAKAETWVVITGGVNYYPVYVGMITSVQSDKSLYLLEEVEQTNIQTAPTKLTWKKLGESSGTGAVGPTGPTGATGATGPTGSKGDAGAAGAKGEKGDTGAQGPQGEKGEKGDTGAAAGFGSPTGSITIDDTTGTPYVTITATGPDTAKIFNFAFSGIKGKDGANGAQGPQGEKGDQGPAGKDGTGVTIKGSFASESALKEAHATGKTGDAYLVAGDLYVWSGEKWENVGRIEGPMGPMGPTGDPGKDGVDGAKGDQGPIGPTGSSAYQIWLDNGNTGDEAAFLASLKGVKGDKGDTGAIGPQGEKGDKGDSGYKFIFSANNVNSSELKGVHSSTGNHAIAKVDKFTLAYSNPDQNDDITVSTQIVNMSNVIGRGIQKLRLNNTDAIDTKTTAIDGNNTCLNDLGTLNTEASGVNTYDIIYDSIFEQDNDSNRYYEQQPKAISIHNGRGIANMQPTGSVVAGTMSTLKQSVNVTYSDGATTSFDMPIPSFTAASSNSLTINGATKTFSLGVSSASDKYGYALSITGPTTSIYAPTNVGSANHILVSKGSGAPEWRSLSDSTLLASNDNFGTIKVATVYDSDNLANGLDITSGILSTVRCSESGYGVVKVTSGNGLSVNNGVITKSADSLRYEKDTSRIYYKINGATSEDYLDLIIDDGVIS